MYKHTLLFVLLASFLVLNQAGPAFVGTHRNDNYRSGQNPLETTLTPSNVNDASFGLIQVSMYL